MQLNDEPQNYYDVLELTPDATPQEIRSAYLRLKASYGKDNIAHYSVYSREETEQMLQRIEEAYIILSNSERRRSYDLSHVNGSSQESSPFVLEKTPVIAVEPAPPTTPAHNTSPTPAFDDSFISMEQDWSGPAIKRVRESKRISIEDLADFTRISKNHLIALEEEAYQKLPAIVYVRGFIQQISKRLKLPSDTVAQKYIDRLKAARPEKF